ncbi:hypothetical protein EV426DRAFT_593644 [Tirmania nivea]|nr:hypothetical protein EV426DRAFT_593644 [Tirmania nivea]
MGGCICLRWSCVNVFFSFVYSFGLACCFTSWEYGGVYLGEGGCFLFYLSFFFLSQYELSIYISSLLSYVAVGVLILFLPFFSLFQVTGFSVFGYC